jgi:hypothetical protein
MKRQYTVCDPSKVTNTTQVPTQKPLILPQKNEPTTIFDIQQYTFNELLEVFDLPNSITLTEDHLRQIRRQVLSLHPDKNKKIPVEYYQFFKSAYELIESYYQTIKRQKAIVPTDKIHYDTAEISSRPTTINVEHIKTDDFNRLFEDKIGGIAARAKTDEERDRLSWFRDDDSSQNIYGKVEKTEEIHGHFDQIRDTQKKGLVVYDGEFRPLLSFGGGQSFYDEPDKGYITCNPFDKLKYDDISRVHRDQPIITVDKSEFTRASQPRNMEQYKKAPDFQMMDRKSSQKILDDRATQFEKQILEKRHIMEQTIVKNEQLNGEILAQFMLLTNKK